MREMFQRTKGKFVTCQRGLYNTGKQNITSSRLVVYHMYKQGYKEGNKDRETCEWI